MGSSISSSPTVTSNFFVVLDGRRNESDRHENKSKVNSLTLSAISPKDADFLSQFERLRSPNDAFESRLLEDTLDVWLAPDKLDIVVAQESRSDG